MKRENFRIIIEEQEEKGEITASDMKKENRHNTERKMRIQYVRTNESERVGSVWKGRKTRIHYIYKIIKELSLFLKSSSFHIHLEVNLVYSALDDKKEESCFLSFARGVCFPFK